MTSLNNPTLGVASDEKILIGMNPNASLVVPVRLVTMMSTIYCLLEVAFKSAWFKISRTI